MNWINLFISLCCYIALPCEWAVFISSSREKKNIILGVTLPAEARRDARVLALAASFRRTMHIACSFLSVLVLPPLFFDSFGLGLTYAMVWLLAALVVPTLIFARANGRLLHLKRECGWTCAPAGVRLVDTRAAAEEKRRIPVWAFLPPVLVCAASAVPACMSLSGAGLAVQLFLYGTMTVLTALMYVFYRLGGRGTETVDADTARTLALTECRRRAWSVFWLTGAYLTAFYTALLSWSFTHTAVFLSVTILYTGALLAAALAAEFSARSAQARLCADCGAEEIADEDVFWPLGLVYVNPADPRFLVEERVGIGMTVNLARPAAKVLYVFCAVLLLAMPVLGIWLYEEESADITLIMSDTALTASHGWTEYEIPLAEIRSVILADSLSGAGRISGTGLEDFSGGLFYFNETGEAHACLNPQVPPYLILRTAEDTYVFGAEDGDTVRQLYETLLAAVGSDGKGVEDEN